MPPNSRHQHTLALDLSASLVPLSPLKPEYIRLPLPSKRCPYTGLSRTTICELCVPSEANGHKPPVKSVIIRKRNALRGIRLVHYDSLLSHLSGLPDSTGGEEANAL